jgi:hypothetical protein
MIKYIAILSIIITAMIPNIAHTQDLDFSTVKKFEQQLDDVMEIIDTTELKIKLRAVEENYNISPAEINKAKLGIIYHEVALNLSFFSKTQYKGYAKKSFEILSQLHNDTSTSRELMPFIAAYRASALSLIGAETKKLQLLNDAFKLFDTAVANYSTVSYAPEFLRGSVAENLPWFFFTKRKFARCDFQSIIDRQNSNSNYATWKVMSFTYWAWANERRGKKHKAQGLIYLNKAIALDAYYKAGRKKAEELKAKRKM